MPTDEPAGMVEIEPPTPSGYINRDGTSK